MSQATPIREAKIKPSEVRARVLAEHVQIRAMLSELEVIAQRALDGAADDGALLRAKAIELYGKLDAHMSLEEAFLYPAICDSDAWGQIRGDRMKQEHARQREVFSQLTDLQSRVDTVALIFVVRGLAADLREDMCREERELLNPELLRDDVISIAQNSG